MEGVLSLESIYWSRSTYWERISQREYLQSATKMNKMSYMNINMRDTERVSKLREYFKFTMIRNPLERLVSAYRNKIEPPLEFCDHDRRRDPLIYNLSELSDKDVFQAHQRLILSKYHPDIFRQWAQANEVMSSVLISLLM